VVELAQQGGGQLRRSHAQSQYDPLGSHPEASPTKTRKLGGLWYCDFRTDEETFVVFAGRVFRYPRGEAESRAEAEAYDQFVGVPEAQLDWPE